MNPVSRPYLRVVRIRTVGHMGGGNRRGGYTLMRVATTHAG